MASTSTLKSREKALNELMPRAQDASNKLQKVANYLKIELGNFQFLPEDNPCEKLISNYLKTKKLSTCFSSMKTIQVVGARVLYGMVCNSAGMVANFNAYGLMLWRHGWQANAKCWHGEPLYERVNEIDLPGTSENGMNAMKDGKGVVTVNKYGRSVVRITQDHAGCCFEDKNMKFGQNAPNSCGATYSDTGKAKLAMKHAAEYGACIFPNARKQMAEYLIVPSSCMCNYGGKSIMGKQLCRITPYTLSGAEGINPEGVSPEQSVSCRFPAVFVFQCCNTGARRGTDTPKQCEFKVSYPDLMSATMLVKMLWNECFNESVKLNFPVFKWKNEYKVRTAMLPVCPVIADEDDNPFGLDDDDEQNGKKRAVEQVGGRKKKRKVVVLDSEDDDERETDENE